MPDFAMLVALDPENCTRTWPLVRRRRKSGSESRKATDLVAELYGHVKVTTALIDLVEGAESTGVSCAIGMCIVVSNVVARPLVTWAIVTIFPWGRPAYSVWLVNSGRCPEKYVSGRWLV
jgi:hypothetical protein